jgi:hypothetical protein
MRTRNSKFYQKFLSSIEGETCEQTEGQVHLILHPSTLCILCKEHSSLLHGNTNKKKSFVFYCGMLNIGHPCIKTSMCLYCVKLHGNEVLLDGKTSAKTKDGDK